jgi:hypothetical protein
MKKISFNFILFIMFSCTVQAQSVDNNQTIYTLSPLLSVTPKIYLLNESVLRKYQLPQNYMIVQNPLKDIVTLWEFPNEFPASQAQQLPAATPAAQSTNTVPEKQKSLGKQNLPAELAQMTKMLESLGLESGKEFSIRDLNQPLPDLTKK